jgi:uncharacterized protein YndB with AHSA1/START domain
VTARNSSVDLDRDPKTIVATHEFEAPRALAFEVWTDPRHLAHKHLAQWWGPDGFTITTSRFEMKVGGVWRFVMHGPDGRDYENRITFDEIVPPDLIRYHHGGGDDVEPVQFRTTVTFEELERNLTRVTLHATFPSAAERDRVVKEYGAAEGAKQTLSRLADYVASRTINKQSA